MLLLFVALILAFVVLHTIEHGVEGLLFSCAILAAVFLRLVVVLGPGSSIIVAVNALALKRLRLPGSAAPPTTGAAGDAVPGPAHSH